MPQPTSKYRIAAALAFAALCTFGAMPALASLHPGDELSVMVYNHPELSSNSIKVDSRGRITLPLAGEVNVAGLEPKAASRRIERALAPFVEYPAVDIGVVAETKSIFVTGGPGGVLDFAPGETLSAALEDVQKTLNHASPANDNSGASTDVDALSRSRIDLRRVAIVRDGKRAGIFDVVALRRKGSPGPELQPGDTIALVNKAIAVDVSGAVAKPGTAYLSKDEPLSDAIAQAGGTLSSAASSHIRLQRDGEAPKLLALGDPIFTEGARDGDSLSIPSAPRVSVVGMVEHPGPVVLQSNFSLLSALYTAGGPSKYGNLRDVQVMHDGARTSYDVTKLTHGDLTQDPTLQDGDLVFVPEGHRVDFLSIFQTLLPVLYLLH